ncbi:MAG: hypothetical protein ACYCSW_11365 [bacterium]
MVKSIYLDVCTLSRPFDDQKYLRIRLETDAVNLILLHIKTGEYRFLYSPVHTKEIANIKNLVERIDIQILLNTFGDFIKIDFEKTRRRAEKLSQLGFGLADAAHVAFSEGIGAEFISCDDKLIKKCEKYKIGVWCGNPITFCIKENLR